MGPRRHVEAAACRRGHAAIVVGPVQVIPGNRTAFVVLRRPSGVSVQIGAPAQAAARHLVENVSSPFEREGESDLAMGRRHHEVVRDSLCGVAERVMKRPPRREVVRLASRRAHHSPPEALDVIRRVNVRWLPFERGRDSGMLLCRLRAIGLDLHGKLRAVIVATVAFSEDRSHDLGPSKQGLDGGL